jgi:signal transduction histidine kinase/DNA-binding response OmpR family regulator
MRLAGEDRPAIYVVIALLVAGAFVFDLVTHVGLEVWVLYFVPLVISFSMSRSELPLVIAFSCVALVAAGFFVSPPPPSAEMVGASVLNRSLGAAALITLGFVGQLLVRTKVRLAVQDWINEGQVQLAERMRGERDENELGRGIVSLLAEYAGATVGSIYAGEASTALTRVGGYGLDPRAGEVPDVVAFGQTLVGQVAADGKLLTVHDVPEGYLDVRSGTGAAKPQTLLLAPANADGVVNGVIELGFFRPPPLATRALLESVAAPVGIAIRSAQYRRRQAELLEETQRQAEELEDQGRALKESHSELEETNTQLEEQARALATQAEHLAAAQEVLKNKAAEVERASRYKSEFLANMSHELRTPLNSALILAKLLVDNRQGNLSAEQVQYATNIYAAGNDLLTLINDILDLSKIEAGRLELAFEPLDLARLFEQAKQRFEPLAKEKRLALAVAIESDCPAQIESDATRLQQVVTNLLSNAIKFTERGSVRLRAAAGSRGDVQLEVVDTGIGIPAHQHEIIFDAFRQADGTTNRKYGGTGLGLSICRELVDLLGGEMRLTSMPGEGSTFTVVLPTRADRSRAPRARKADRPRSDDGDGRARARIATTPAEDDRAALSDGSRAVLVIEDDLPFAEILRDLARELQFQCVIARSAAEGIELARRIGPAAIVLDMGLPDHSGLTVLELLKRDPAVRHIPIHVVSVFDYQQVAREMGAMGYALKPVKREQLVTAFRRLESEIRRKPRAVLVVEDDTVQRDAIAKLLGTGDTRITSASTAEEALAKLDSEPFDCVVLDLMLPETSGFELLARMAKSARDWPPVIVYTARALTVGEEQELRRHARSIIVKGAQSPERLLEEVTLFLHQVAAELPEESRRMLREALDREAVFTGRRILIVEDDVRNIFALTSALEPKGAVVDVARNGKEALQRALAHPPVDLILMDLMMPEMDGLAATREIRRQPRAMDLPIIALTAKAMPDDRQRCLEAGANDYIAKPIDVEKLISLCRVWMPR